MTTFGLPRRHVAECASTNDLAREWATEPTDPAPHGALMTADHQTRGRGRRGHGWEAASSQSALMSFVLRPSIPLSDCWQLGFLAALSTVDAVRELGVDARLKWPNDVLLNGRKVAGVLVETALLAPEARASTRGFVAIAGIGLNVNQTAFDAVGYAYPPTSLRLATGREQKVADVIDAVSRALGRWDDALRRAGFDPLAAACRERLALGATVRCGSQSAALAGLLPDGSASVQLPDGTFAVWTTLEG